MKTKPGTSPNDLKMKLSNPDSKAAAKIARKRIDKTREEQLSEAVTWCEEHK